MIEEWKDPREGVPESDLVEIRIAVYQVMPGGERRLNGGPMMVTPKQAEAWGKISQLKYMSFTEEVLSMEPRPIDVCLEHYHQGDFIEHIYPHPHGVVHNGGAEQYLVALLEEFDYEKLTEWCRERDTDLDILPKGERPWRHPAERDDRFVDI